MRKIERTFKPGDEAADSEPVPDATPNDTDFRHSLVAAVQAELQRHGAAISAEIERLRKGAAEERAQLREDIQTQIDALARAVEEARTQADVDSERQKAAFEARVIESESRQSRRLDDVTGGITATVQAAAKPVLADLSAENARIASRIDTLETQLRKFDEQAARMVTYVNELMERVEARNTEVVQDLQDRFAAEVGVLRPLVDEIDSSVRRFQSDIGTQVSTRLNDAEDRFNSRLMAGEARMKEATGAQVAEIQAHVGRVSNHIDETLAVLNNRHEQVAEQFLEVGRRIDGVEESISGVDQHALDELREKMSSAVGEAMLVRIEMERLEKAVNERTDSLAVRMTEVETTLADTAMDVSTAIQLDRLEELERAVTELDPTRFKAYDASAGAHPVNGHSAPAPVEHDPVEPDPVQPDSAAAPDDATPHAPPPPPSFAAPIPKDSLNGSSAVAEELTEPAGAPFVPPRT